jgi:hypothetical protein
MPFSGSELHPNDINPRSIIREQHTPEDYLVPLSFPRLDETENAEELSVAFATFRSMFGQLVSTLALGEERMLTDRLRKCASIDNVWLYNPRKSMHSVLYNVKSISRN